VKALAFAVAIALCAIACGSVMQTTHSPAPVMASGRPDSVRSQIDELDRDIASRMKSGAMPAPTGAEIEGARPIAMDAAAGVCTPPPAPSASCDDACRLGDAICDDARRICDLAQQLPGDSWASGKCDSGKASCERAKQRCCDCK
jgi:hypothetical protein